MMSYLERLYAASSELIEWGMQLQTEFAGLIITPFDTADGEEALLDAFFKKSQVAKIT